MSRRRLAGAITPVHILVLVAFLEVAINRVAVPMLRPFADTPPLWHKQLDFIGLFAFYFSGTLAAVLIFRHCYAALREWRGMRDVVAQLVLAATAVLASIPLFTAPDWLAFPLELAFAVAVLALVVSSFARDRDLGIQMGMIVLAVPLLVHTVSVIGAHFDWPEGTFDAPNVSVARAGVLALCAAALVSPYVFAPRPFARAVTKPAPVLVAMAIAATGALAARAWYPTLAKIAALAIGVELEQRQADPRLALYLLGIATLAWTLASCALASSPARRSVAVGIALIVLGGYEFRWPNHYLLPLFGVAIVADAARRVRDEELAAMPIACDTPPVADTAWSSYIGTVTTALKRTLDEVHSLTSRGDNGLSSTLIVGDRAGLPVRTRIERMDGSVLALDVVLGREIDEVRGATLTLWAIPPRSLGVNPPAPPSAPLVKTADEAFDQRFRTRGSAQALDKLLDEGLRARAVATLDGWLAYWEPDGLRYRVYPGRGAPLDHPMPLSDLALGRPASAERIVAVIELLVEIAARGVVLPPAEEPSQIPETAE